MSHPHVPFDPTLPVSDPIAAEMEHQAELDATWEEGYLAAVADRRWRAAEILLAALSGAVLGAAAVIAWTALS